MKKILLIVLISLQHIYTQAQCNNLIVKTPKNSNISACTNGGHTPAQVQQADTYSRTFAITVFEAGTSNYNCHAHAWHVSEGGNKVWIDNFSPISGNLNNLNPYWTDGSYFLTAYTNQNNVNNLKVFYGSTSSATDHSAITTSTVNTYISKMGAGCLVSHLWNNSPYNTANLKFYQKMPQINGPDVIGASCSGTFSVSGLPPIGISNQQWSVIGGNNSGLTPSSGSGTSFTTSRTSDVNDPNNATIQFSFTSNGQTYSIQKAIVIRIIPTPFLVQLSNHNALAIGQVGVPYYFSSPLPQNQQSLVQEYQWELTIGGNVNEYMGATTQNDPVTFSSAGTYPLRVRLRDGCGWSRWVSMNVYIQ